jgi:hypothetical protein
VLPPDFTGGLPCQPGTLRARLVLSSSMWLLIVLLTAPLAAMSQDVAAQAVPVTQTAAYNPRLVRSAA